MASSTKARIARSLLTLWLILSASLACSVQLGALPNAQSAQSSNSVMFVAPAINSVLAENATIVFAVKVQDTGAGVLQVDFLADDRVFGSQTTPTGQGLASYTFMQSWQAQGVRGHLMSAIAHRADDSIVGRAEMTIQVVASSTAAIATTDGTPTLSIPTNITSEPTANPRQVLPTNTPASNVMPSGSGPTLRVVVDSIFLRSGPGTNYPTMASLKINEEAAIIGRNSDSTWWFIERNGDRPRGWVTSNATYSTVTGDTSAVPFVTTPSTPLPSATPVPNSNLAPTSTASANADLVLDSYVLSPTEPIANQTFNIVITVRNQGSVDASSSLLTGLFQPGSERSAMAVPAIPAGQTVTLPPMYVTLKLRAANQIGLLTLDANGEIDEGTNGEANNVRTVPYNVK